MLLSGNSLLTKLKRNISGCILLLGLSASALETPPSFNLALYPGQPTGEGNGVATDSNGNIYVTGQYNGTGEIAGGTVTGQGAQDYFLASFDSTGAPRWGIGAGTTGSDYGTSVKIAANGDVVVSASIFMPATIHGTNFVGSGGRDAIVARYTSAGSLLWLKTVGGSTNDEGDEVHIDGAGNIILAGRINGVVTIGSDTIGTASTQRQFLAKFDADGNPLWAKAVSSKTVSTGTGVTTDGSNNIYVTGHDVIGSTEHIMVGKYNPSGTQIWSTNHPTGAHGTGIDLDADGNVYICGTFSNPTMTFGSTTLSNANGQLRGYIAKHDPNGNPLWAVRAGGRAYRLSVTSSGDIYTGGFYLAASGNFDTTSGEGATLSGLGSNDGFLTKHDSSGTLVWAYPIATDSREILRSVTADDSGVVHVTGEGVTKAFDLESYPQLGSVVVARLGTTFIPKYLLTRTVSPSFSGSIIPSPSTGDSRYFSNAVVQLTAVPGPGKTFVGWSNAASGTVSPTTVTMDGNKTVTAIFTNAPVPSFQLTLQITPVLGGSVQLSPTAPNNTYDSNTVVTLTAQPNTNYVFVRWFHPINSTNPTVQLTMDSAKSIFCQFSNVASASYVFHEIAWTNTPAPSATGNFTTFGAPIIDRSNVVFYAENTGGRKGFYQWNGATLSKLVDTADTPPNSAGQFRYFPDYDIKHADNGNLLFGGTNSSGIWGVYSLSNSVMSKIVDSNDNVPGSTNKFKRVRSGVQHNGEVGFVGYRTVTNSSFLASGIYTLKNGTMTKVLDQDSPVLPGSTQPYLAGDFIDLENGNLSLYAAQGTNAIQTSGIYFKDTSGFTLIANTNTVVPGTTNKFNFFIDWSALENGKVLFWAQWPSGFSSAAGIFSANTDGSDLKMLVGTGITDVPQTSGIVFTYLNGASYKNGRLAFVAGASSRAGVYIWENGSVYKVVENLGSVLKYNFPVSHFAISSQAIQEDGYITFRAFFHFNGQSAIYTTHPGAVQRYKLTFISNPPGLTELYQYPNIHQTNQIPAGTQMYLTASVNPGYQFTGWSGALGNISADTNPLSFLMNSNMTIVANYQNTNAPVVQFTVTTNVSPVGAGSIIASPGSANNKYNSNTVVTLTAVPASGKAFAGWTGAISSSSNPVQVTVVANGTITATFTNIPTPGPSYLLTTIASPLAGGTITANPTSGDGTYPSNTLVSLTATANAGYGFSHWTGLATPATTATISTRMRANRTLTAVFTNLPMFQLTTGVTPLAAGTITASPTSGSGLYPAGTIVTLTAANDGTNRFSAWFGGISGITNQIHVTMNGNKSITALFNNPGDFVLQKTNGQLAVWFMDQKEQITAALLNNGVALGANWRLTGAADFDGNGSSDLVLRGLDGKAALWLMDGNHRIGSVSVRNGLALVSAWRLAAAGDFNKDSNPDLLWQNSATSKLHVWLMDGTAYNSNATLVNTIAGEWRVATAADMDGNNSSDIVFQHTTGKVAVWLMDGLSRTASVGLRGGYTPPSGWLVAGAKDIDEDGNVDLVFQHRDGRLMVWFFVGTTYNRAEVITKTLAPGWFIRAIK